MRNKTPSLKRNLDFSADCMIDKKLYTNCLNKFPTKKNQYSVLENLEKPQYDALKRRFNSNSASTDK